MDALPPDDTDLDLFGEALAELVTIGMNVARTIDFLTGTEAAKVADAPAGVAAQAAAHLADAFDRVARAVRRTALLARHLDDPASPPALRRDAHRRSSLRRHIAREVQDTIYRRAPDRDAAQGLEAELRERLEQPELDLDIDHRPPKEIVRDICRDLGIVSTAFIRRTPADIAALDALANPTHPPRPPPTTVAPTATDPNARTPDSREPGPRPAVHDPPQP